MHAHLNVLFDQIDVDSHSNIIKRLKEMFGKLCTRLMWLLRPGRVLKALTAPPNRVSTAPIYIPVIHFLLPIDNNIYNIIF